ncbi:MAG: hypothetical protein ACKV2T_04470 [Kofleriaceae bacterium]
MQPEIPTVYTEIANDIAAAALAHVERWGQRDLISLLDQPHRSGLSSALHENEPAMMRALHIALRPFALAHSFEDMHIGSSEHGIICLLREKIAAPL